MLIVRSAIKTQLFLWSATHCIYTRSSPLTPRPPLPFRSVNFRAHLVRGGRPTTRRHLWQRRLSETTHLPQNPQRTARNNARVLCFECSPPQGVLIIQDMSNVKTAPDVKGTPGKTREEKLADALAKSKQIVAKKAEYDLCQERWLEINCDVRLLRPKADKVRATASTPREIEAVLRLDAEVRQKLKAVKDGIDRERKIRSEISALEKEYEAMCDDVVLSGDPIDTKLHEDEDVKVKVEAIDSARSATFDKQEGSKKRQVGEADEEAPMEKKVKVEVMEVKEEM